MHKFNDILTQLGLHLKICFLYFTFLLFSAVLAVPLIFYAPVTVIHERIEDGRIKAPRSYGRE